MPSHFCCAAPILNTKKVNSDNPSQFIKMGFTDVILSLCCLAEELHESGTRYDIAPTEVRYTTPAQYSAMQQRVRVLTTLSEFGTPRDILTHEQTMAQLYGTTSSIRGSLSNFSMRQPAHPGYITPRIIITPPTVRGV